MKRAQSQGGDAPCVGTVKRNGVGDSVLRGSQDFAGSGKGGTEWKGTESLDGRSLTFRKLNNADPTAKNV